ECSVAYTYGTSDVVLLLLVYLVVLSFFFFNGAAPSELYTLSLHDALPISSRGGYALECAADIILRLEKTGPRTVTLGFQNEKFIEEPADQGLQLVPRDQSLVVEAAGTVARPAKSGKRDTNKVAERRDKLVA